MSSDCIFCRIVRGEVPSRKIYEDDAILAFHDIHPLAKVHFMLIPKQHLQSMAELDDSHSAMMGRIMTLAPRLARETGATNGFRLIANTGNDGRQEVQHLHVHVLGGELLPAMIVRKG